MTNAYIAGSEDLKVNKIVALSRILGLMVDINDMGYFKEEHS